MPNHNAGVNFTLVICTLRGSSSGMTARETTDALRSENLIAKISEAPMCEKICVLS